MTKKSRSALLFALVIVCGAAVQLLAQGKKKAPMGKPAPAARKTVSTDPQLKEYDSTHYHYFLFPQFYSYWPIENRDTVLKFECYNAEGNFMNMDTVYDITQLQHMYLVKTYLDYTQTVIDAEGGPKPMPISNKVYQYHRTGADTWASKDLIYEVSSSLIEHKNDIVKTDTTIVVDRVNGTREITIRKYYRVEEQERSDVSRDAPVNIPQNENDQTATSATHYVTIYYVPEFYFKEQKRNKDTILEFLCYDNQDSLMSNVSNYDSVHYYSLFKTYTDSAHTYIDDKGQKQLLPVTNIIKRYDHLAENKWMSIEYPKNKYQELTTYKDIIIRSDTATIEDPIDGSTIQKVFNYYKVGK